MLRLLLLLSVSYEFSFLLFRSVRIFSLFICFDFSCFSRFVSNFRFYFFRTVRFSFHLFVSIFLFTSLFVSTFPLFVSTLFSFNCFNSSSYSFVELFLLFTCLDFLLYHLSRLSLHLSIYFDFSSPSRSDFSLTYPFVFL